VKANNYQVIKHAGEISKFNPIAVKIIADEK